MSAIDVAVGGLVPSEVAETASDRPGGRVRYHYAPTTGRRYSVSVPRRRLTAVLTRGDEGYVAEAPEINGLGYGANPLAALADLQSSVGEYLEVLKEGAELAPAVRHHADFLHLLDVPRGSWFAALRLAPEDAADLE